MTRLFDQFLSRETMTSTSQAQFDATRLDRLQQLEAVFAGGDDGIGQSAGALLNAMVDLANERGGQDKEEGPNETTAPEEPAGDASTPPAEIASSEPAPSA